MSENTKKTEQSSIDAEPSSIKPKKHKHNSKRRRPKKNQSIAHEEVSCSTKVDEVVNYLCNTISKNESETSVETNPPVKVAKESLGVRVCSGQNHNRNSKFKYLAAVPGPDLNSLFENLQVQKPSTLSKSKTSKQLPNLGCFKKANCKSLSVEDLEKMKQDRTKKVLNMQKERGVSNEKLDEYFNLSALSQYPGQNFSDSMQLVSDLEQTLYSNLSQILSSTKASSQFPGYNGTTRKSSINDEHEYSPKYSLTEEESKLTKGETVSKNKRLRKKKNKTQKGSPVSSPVETQNFEDNQKMFLNSNDIGQQKTSSGEHRGSENLKNRKRQHSSKNTTPKTDTKFPKYLSAEELQSISTFGVLLSGIIRINQKNYKEAYITAPDKGMDILIEGLRDRNRALEGDEVYFVLKPKGHYRTSADSTDVQRTAVVVGIKTLNHNRGAIGTLNVIKNKNVNFALFSPRDSRLPRIRIRKHNWPLGFSENSESFKDKLYFAKISQWSDLRFADGEIVKEVGIVGDIQAETDALLLKYELDITPYSREQTEFLPPPHFKISEKELSGRLDLRKECIFTIDPATAVDLDDAVSCKKLPNGNYEIGVHISDVSYFLTEGTPLDLAVSKRATTVYLVQKAYHMLPLELCRLCSLTPGEDKLSFSVFWEITPEMEIISHRFSRSVINSCAQFAYEQVQSIIDSSPSNETTIPKIFGDHKLEDIKDTIKILHKIAMFLRKNRFSNGALRIDQKKIYFLLDENHLPIDYKVEVYKDSNKLIEEFMLLANITVAQKLKDRFPDIAFLRCHSPPLQFILERYQKNLEKYGIILDISSSSSLQASLLKYSGDDTESVARMLVLNSLLAKPMARAKYYCSSVYESDEDRRHYALNVPLYTHFTSPLRRYADVMTHRLLAAALYYCSVPNWTVDFVQSIASNCNKQKYAAKMAQESSTELFLSVYIAQKGSLVSEAVVSDIKDKSFDCIVLSTGAHQRIYFEHIGGELYQEKEDGILRLTIKWPKDENHESETLQIIEMFSIVKIELKRVNALKIEAKLLRYK